MNERIRELAKESDLDWHKHWNDDESNRLEKFAELIVRECVDICRSDDWEDQQGWGKLYAHKIQKHFGVER